MTSRADKPSQSPEPDRSKEWSFLVHDVLTAAQCLIGCRLIRQSAGGIFTARIVETEAYHQSEPGSHAYKGSQGRAAIMFEAPGKAYVYLIYGMYHCLNVVTCPSGIGAAVLIRAAEFESVSGLAIDSSDQNYIKKLSGPGKLCRELEVDRSLNGIDLLNCSNAQLWLLPAKGESKIEIETSKRIGLSTGKELKWRFYENGNINVSRLPAKNR